MPEGDWGGPGGPGNASLWFLRAVAGGTASRLCAAPPMLYLARPNRGAIHVRSRTSRSAQ